MERLEKTKQLTCIGCTWCSQCKQAIRCDLYDPINEDNYIWSEMEYNEEKVKEGNYQDVYEVGEMQEWYKLNNQQGR